MKFKKIFLLMLTISILTLKTNVYACGEIKELTSDIGSVSTEDNINYTVTVPEETREVTLKGTTDYEWVQDFGPRKVKTDATAELKVDGKSCGYGIYTYFIKFKTMSNIIAENTPEDNARTEAPNDTNNNEQGPVTEPNENTIKLKDLTIEGYSIDFDPQVFDYELEVDSSVKELNITPTLEDNSNSTVVISDNVKKLVDGENIITISLNAENNTALYTIKVTKQKLKSNNNYLASITVVGHQLNFDASQTNYTLELNKESSLNINVVTESALASYEILGNNNLKDGSTVTIRVTAEDGSTKDYLINVTSSFNIMDYWIYIVIGLLVLLLILLIIIMKQKKNKKEKPVGPTEVGTLETTAGSLPKETPTSNEQTGAVENFTFTNDTATTTPNTSVELQIIEPTNIEDSIPTGQTDEVVENFQDVSVDENTSPTEIFKL